MITQHPASDFAPEFRFDPVPTGSSGSTSTATYRDSEFDTVSLTSSYNNWIYSETLGADYTYENLTPSICGISGWPSVTKTTAGTGKIAISNSKAVVVAALTFSNGVTQTSSSFQRFTAASLADVLSDGILNLITEGKEEEYFTNYTPSGTPTKNTDCWAAGLDLTACPLATNLFNSWSSANRGGAITRQHVVGCAHQQYSFPAPGASSGGYTVGHKFRFMGSTGVVTEHTVIGVAGYGDCKVATITPSLPVTVTPFKVAGDWFIRNRSDANGTASFYMGGAVFWPDQFFRCRYQLCGTAATATTSVEGDATIGITVVSDRIQRGVCQSSFSPTPEILTGKTAFLAPAIVGDSGSPVLLIANGEPALLGTWWYPNDFYAAWGSSFLNALIVAADAAAGVSTGLTVTVAPDPTL
jgi:hypothetical protein